MDLEIIKGVCISVKRILFKVHSSYSLFTAALIGLLYYSDCQRILITNSDDLTIDVKRRIKKSRVFSVCVGINSYSSLITAEKEVERIIGFVCEADELFIAAYELPFERVLVDRVHEMTHVNLMPEGCGAINYQYKIAEHLNGISGKEQIYYDLEKKYPIDFGKFFKVWLYDLDMPHGPVTILRQLIDVRLAISRFGIVESINLLFGYIPEKLQRNMMYYIDVNFSVLHRMSLEREREVIEAIFSNVKDHIVWVKPHPSQELCFERFKFDYPNAYVLKDIRIPFELIYLNILSNAKDKNTDTDLVIIDPMTSTATWSAMIMSGNNDKVTIISFNQIKTLGLHEFDVLLYYKFTHDYYMEVVKKKENVVFLEPTNIEELRKSCFCISFNNNKDFKDESISFTSHQKNKDLNVLQKYHLIGNLFAKSLLFVDKECFCAYYSFENRKCCIKFYVDKNVDFNHLDWMPSVNNIFWRHKETKIIICINGIESVISGLRNDCGIINESDGGARIECSYNGHCDYIRIESVLDTRNAYITQAELLVNYKWEHDFWKNWYYCEKQIDLRPQDIKKKFPCLWIFGKGEIGRVIGDKLRQVGVKVYYVQTKGNNRDGERIYGIDELDLIQDTPVNLVITPMYDYYPILMSIPICYRRFVIKLIEFINGICECTEDKRG